MKHNGHPMDVLTDPKSLADVLTPPDPQHKEFPHSTCKYLPEHTDIQGAYNLWKCWTPGKAPPLPWGSNRCRTPHPHITCRYPLEHTDTQGSMGTYKVFEHMRGVGGIQMYGGVWMSPKIKTCLPHKEK